MDLISLNITFIPPGTQLSPQYLILNRERLDYTFNEVTQHHPFVDADLYDIFVAVYDFISLILQGIENTAA